MVFGSLKRFQINLFYLQFSDALWTMLKDLLNINVPSALGQIYF